MTGTVAYALSKKYTDDTAAQFGGLKGAPCKVKSVIKSDGVSIITLEWKNDAGETQTSEVRVNDGTPIYTWEPNYTYHVGDLVIYSSNFYRCISENNDSVFTPSKWNEIGASDGNYDIIDTVDELPASFTSTDRKMFYVISEGIFYLWNGTEWIAQQPNTISDEDIDDLFI